MGNDANGTGSEGPERPQQIRNVVLVGSASSGKTSLFERLVTARTPGRHSRGEPVASTSLRAASVTSGPIHVNLVDTPGHPDFVGEVRAGLRAADAVLFVVSACDEIDEATRLLWRECAVAGMPRAVAVTKLEQARADFDETVARCQRAFGGAQPADIPLLSGRSLARLVNLLRRTVTDYRDGTPTVRGPDAEEAALIEERRGPLMESIIEESEDEVLLERHLNGEDIEFEMVATDLRAAIATARFFPVVATHAPSGMGIEELYELFEHGFPPPDAAALPAVQTASGEDFGPLTCDPDGPLVAEVVRTTSDPFVGRLSLVRVFSGRLRPDTPLHVSGHLQRFAAHLNVGHPDHDSDDERAGPLAAPLGEETRPKPQAIAGDLVLVSKLTAAETSDTLSGKNRPALVEPWLLPEPLLPVAVHAASRNEEEKLVSALQRLVAEDVTMRLEQNAETHQLVLWTMGPAHVDKLLTALRESWRVGVEVEPVRTSLRETFLRPTTVQGRLVKQSGGHGQYAVCQMEIEPLERGAGVQFAERVVGGAVPRQFIPSVEKGIRNQMSKGVLAGYPMVDVRVTLVDGKAHSVDSSDMAFQTAAASGLREAANESTVALLEPIDAVDITVAEDSVGSVLADLRSRRGQVHGTEAAPQPGYIVVHAEIPAHELSRYPIDLRSVSHGTGSFTRRFVRYDYLPAALARELTSA
ncbi:MAG TPA: elongation factor G-like protein EF-G2 [Propionibacteriaceae bacterium]|jgi:elongation factor G|nr:elongation factor G-like protein EF-G2 [Propionibacteriaceae bacterium]